MRGTNVVYGDVETALGHAVASAAAPWAKSHDAGKNKEGWELFVEVTNADANYDDDRVVFSLGVRATLRQRSGNDYLAQHRRAADKAASSRLKRAPPSCTAA